MKICDIDETMRVKLNRTSITVKDESGKTVGVITNCKTKASLSPREAFSVLGELKAKGLTHNEAMEIISDIAVKDDEIYYFWNQSLNHFVEQYGNMEGFETEKSHLTIQKERVAKLESLHIPVIRCFFL